MEGEGGCNAGGKPSFCQTPPGGRDEKEQSADNLTHTKFAESMSFEHFLIKFDLEFPFYEKSVATVQESISRFKRKIVGNLTTRGRR